MVCRKISPCWKIPTQWCIFLWIHDWLVEIYPGSCYQWRMGNLWSCKVWYRSRFIVKFVFAHIFFIKTETVIYCKTIVWDVEIDWALARYCQITFWKTHFWTNFPIFPKLLNLMTLKNVNRILNACCIMVHPIY